jgi:hypothetical protein
MQCAYTAQNRGLEVRSTSTAVRYSTPRSMGFCVGPLPVLTSQACD